MVWKLLWKAWFSFRPTVPSFPACRNACFTCPVIFDLPYDLRVQPGGDGKEVGEGLLTEFQGGFFAQGVDFRLENFA